MGWYEAAHHADDVVRWVKNSENKIEKWQGIIMGDFDEAHATYLKLARRMRKRGLKARVVTLPEGSAFGMSGYAAGMLKRTVIICPASQSQDNILYRLAFRVQYRYFHYQY